MCIIVLGIFKIVNLQKVRKQNILEIKDTQENY